MKLFGVLGDPISHSLSPVMHNIAFKTLGMDSKYYAFKVNKENLRDAIYGAKALGFGGLNLTIPLKEKALEIVEPTELARKIGAINTIDFKDGIKGYNTDGLGAKKALEERGVKVYGKNVLIVGAGGAARAIAFQLALDGANITIINRTIKRAESLAKDVSEIGNISVSKINELKKQIQNSDILINTTSVGMFPNIDDTIAYSEILHDKLTVFDIVYNPMQTRLIKEAKKAGAKTIEGVMMLIYQGAESFKIWTGKTPPIDLMEKAVKEKLNAL